MNITELSRKKTWFDLSIEMQDMILEYCFAEKVMVCIQPSRTNAREVNEVLPISMSAIAVSKTFATKDQVIAAMLRSAQIVLEGKIELERLAGVLTRAQKSQVHKCKIRAIGNEWYCDTVNNLHAYVKRIITPLRLKEVLPNT